MLLKRLSPVVSIADASMGSAAFFAPLTHTSPVKRFPPFMTILSSFCSEYYFFEGLNSIIVAVKLQGFSGRAD